MEPHLSALAALRIAVFREWPYLYDGSAANEQDYLATLAASPGAGLAVAFADETPVGCSTCLPLAEADAAVTAPFATRGWDPGRFFYFGESVLLPRWRGQGVGVTFFLEREAHARRSSHADYACFCAVRRPAVHLLRPADAVPLDAFWRRRGFVPYPDLVCTMRWKQVDSAERVENALSFWIKPLRDVSLP
ncbi:MAG: GNAT family N-acetyltransferase [Alphaproteobacteria bacterium]|nr:GNAT family N-acetyltransferase [Alphaproteobacteria bacterium]